MNETSDERPSRDKFVFNVRQMDYTTLFTDIETEGSQLYDRGGKNSS